MGAQVGGGGHFSPLRAQLWAPHEIMVYSAPELPGRNPSEGGNQEPPAAISLTDLQDEPHLYSRASLKLFITCENRYCLRYD